MRVTISLGKNVETGQIIHIDNVNKKEKLHFVCVGCSEDLIPVKTEQRGKAWHFRHKVDSPCDGAKDRALHDYAVQVLIANKSIRILEHLTITYSNPRKEVCIFSKRSDVTVSVAEEEIHFEVFVTHDLDGDKIELYKNNQVKCVRIDMSSATLREASHEEIENAVLTFFENKTVFNWAVGKNNRTDRPTNSAPSIWNLILFAIGAYILLRLVKKWRLENDYSRIR